MPLYEYECRCGAVSEHVLPLSATTEERLQCKGCDRVRLCRRVVSRPAKYLGEKHHSPRVYGSDVDTMGHQELPDMPRVAEGKDGTVEAGALREHFETKEWQHWEKESGEVARRNHTKQKRAKSGVSFRHHPVAGDPKL